MTPEDMLIVTEVGKSESLDRDSPEAKHLERRILDIRSYNLFHLARTMLDRRYDGPSWPLDGPGSDDPPPKAA